MRRCRSQHSQTPAEPLLYPEMSRRLDRINRSVYLYEDNLALSIGQEHLAFQSLLPQIQHLVRELCKVKKDIMTCARYTGGAGTNRYQHGTGTSGNRGASRSVQKGQWKEGWTRHPSDPARAVHITPQPDHTDRRSRGNGQG